MHAGKSQIDGRTKDPRAPASRTQLPQHADQSRWRRTGQAKMIVDVAMPTQAATCERATPYSQRAVSFAPFAAFLCDLCG